MLLYYFLRSGKIFCSSGFLNYFEYDVFIGPGNEVHLVSYFCNYLSAADKTNTCHVLHHSSHKSRRVTRSVLWGDVYAFADAFDRACMIQREFQNMLGKSIPLTMFTDSKSLFDVITKCSITTEKRLMIDIKSVREAYDRQEGSDVGFLRSEFNAADTFYGGGTQQGVGQYFGPATMRTRHWTVSHSLIFGGVISKLQKYDEKSNILNGKEKEISTDGMSTYSRHCSYWNNGGTNFNSQITHTVQ